MESELAVVAPIIEAARLAVGQIKSDHLNEIRSLKAPPDAIRDVLEGVLKLMGQADTSWNSMKKFLGNRGIKVHLPLPNQAPYCFLTAVLLTGCIFSCTKLCAEVHHCLFKYCLHMITDGYCIIIMCKEQCKHTAQHGNCWKFW